MKKMSRIISMLAAAMFMTTVALTGCGTPSTTDKPAATQAETKTAEAKKDATKADDKSALPEVKLKMYLIGDRAKDFDLVYGEVNKLLKQDINATVDVNFMSWSDYQQKYPLIFASGEEFDLVYSANWCFYNTQAVKGAYKEITQDMIKQYAPKTAESMYKEAWEQSKVNGKVYMLPMNYKELNPYVYLVRGDLMEKYNISDIKTADDFGKYLDAIAKNEKQLIPCDIGSDQDADAFFWSYGQGTFMANLDQFGGRQAMMGYDASNKTAAKLFPVTQQPQFLEYVKKAKQWKDAGYWSKSALVNKTNVQSSFVNGKSASAIVNVSTCNGTYITTNKAHPEWKLKVFDAMEDKGVILRPYIQNGMSINANSKNVERSLMLLDLFKNDERYANLTTYGIQGKHYDIKDGKIVPLADTANYPVDGNCNWGWREDKLFKQVEGGIPNYNELRANWEKVSYTHPLQFLNFDNSAVKNEMAAVTNVFNSNYKALVMGFSNDPEADVKALNDKMKQAGIDKIMAEAQKQVDEYLKTAK